MKLFYLSLLFLIILYCFDGYLEYKFEISKFWSEKTPKKYTTTNKKVKTVTSESFPTAKPSDDTTNPLLNEDFNYNPSPFSLDDTENLRTLGLSCLPESFGYSKERGEIVFPYHKYPKCSEVNNQTDSYMHIDRKNNVLYMNCPNGNHGKLLTGPVDERKILKSNELANEWRVDYYSAIINSTNIEFGLGTCEDDDNFMQAAMTPIFNEKAYNESKAKLTKKPRIILFLTLDSLSRRHSFRKIPSVIDFLNSLNLNNTDYSVFDYKLHNVLGPDSISNQVPIFGGLDSFKPEFSGNQNIDNLGNTSLWHILREKGYVSLFGLENCDNYFPSSIGRIPKVDYAVGPFYCAVQKYTSMSFDKEYALTQRCLGGHQTHYYILNYTQTMMDMNRGTNMWLYLHLNAAHEATGLHAATLNDDIKDFLQDILNKFGKDHEFFIYLNADHGMRYGNWYKDLEAYQENKLPSLFIIASKSLLNQYPYSYHSLLTNSERLTSKLDLRETTLYLADVIETTPKSINLLNKIAKKSRVCDELGIEPWDCSCMPMVEITSPTEDIRKLLDFLKDLAENVINSMSYSDPKYPIGKVCEKIVLDKIDKIYHVGVSNIHEFFKLEIFSNTQKEMKFQINYFLVSDGFKMQRLSYQYRSETFAYVSPIRVKV